MPAPRQRGSYRGDDSVVDEHVAQLPKRSLVRGAEGLRAGQGLDTDIAKQEGHARIVPRNQWVLSWTRTMARWPPLSSLASQVCRGASSASAGAR